MKKIVLYLAVLISIISSVLSIAGQNNSDPAAKTTSGSSGTSPTGALTSATGGKVTTPAEKAVPMRIPKKIATPIAIDGRVDEDAWRRAAVFKDFYQTQPGYNTAPSKPTEAYMMYDEHSLYLAFKCWDDRDKIRATVAKRDSLGSDDNVRVWLDTYNDRRRAYVLWFNPLGVQQDGIYTEGQGADFTPDIVMESKGVIEDWGWSVEIKIPFKSLRYAAGKGKNWGFSVARTIQRFNGEFDTWMPDDRDVSGFLIKHGRITGLDEIKYEHTLELVPSVTFKQVGERVSAREIAAGRFVNHPVKQEIGVNLKYTISPNVTLDAAINPDFAEIEADAPVITANQRYPIYFSEKRPFFLEGKEIFDTPLQVFYSRNIVDPDAAVKLTGKIDKTSFGFLAASDNAPGNYSENDRTRHAQCLERQRINPALNCPLAEFLDKNALFGVVRVKRDFGSNNNIGYFGTARVFPQNRNFTNGVDGTYKFNSATTMRFQAVGTYSRKNFYSPELNKNQYRSGSGFGYFWNLQHSKDTSGYFIEASGRTKDYRADSGFTRQTNTNYIFAQVRKSTKSDPKAPVIRWDFRQSGNYTYDWSGRLQSVSTDLNWNAQAQGNLFFGFNTGVSREKIYEEDGFGAKRNPAAGIVGGFFGAPTRSVPQGFVSFNMSKTFNRQFSAYGFVGTIFNAFDYDFGGGNRYPRVSPAYLAWVAKGYAGPEPALDPGPGQQVDYNVGFTYKPTKPLTTSLDYTKSKLTRDDTGLVAYDTNIFSWRTTYQFTRFIFARARVDYDTLSSRVAGQYLFGWNPNPGTAFYVGYNDISYYNGFNPYTGNLEPRFERASRTFFIRASYLFRRSF